MGLHEDRTAGAHGAAERRWTWIWLGKDVTDAEIDDLVGQVHKEILKLPAPLGIGEFMLAVSAWGQRRDGVGESVYLESYRAQCDEAVQDDLALRDRPKVVQMGDLARGYVVDRRAWVNGGVREQLRRTLQLYRPSRCWRIVQVSLFSVGEAYLRWVARPN